MMSPKLDEANRSLESMLRLCLGPFLFYNEEYDKLNVPLSFLETLGLVPL